MLVDLPLDDAERAMIAARLFEHIAHRTTDLAEGTIEIDPHMYSDPAVLAAERELIFARVPIIAAHGSELPMPNDFVTVQLPNNEVLLVRQADGSVRGFVNVCRHRGARLVPEACGSTRILSCGYHGWSYNTDGALRSIALAKTFGSVDTSCMGLLEVPTEERHGCVWVVDSTDGEIDVASWLGEMDDVLSAYRLDTYTCYRLGTFDEPINWKVLMDAFVDGYHIAATHGASVAPHFYNNLQTFEQLGRHARVVTARKSIDRIRDREPGEEPIDPHITMGHFIMPNSSFLRQPDHFEHLSFIAHPTDPARCRMTMRILIRDVNLTDKARKRWDKNWDILMAVLRDEDLVMNRDLQHAASNRNVPKMVLGRNEMGNQLFHLWLRSMMSPSET
jgi:phenylpropionate dioxygenase-like ring-hydroxylating dioxygenase large terminal subunit